MHYGKLWWLLSNPILPGNAFLGGVLVPSTGSNRDKQRTQRGHLADIDHTHPSKSFVRELRQVLCNLYDWVSLSKSPLAQTFGAKGQEDPPTALRAIVRNAIEALRPADNVSPRARA